MPDHLRHPVLSLYAHAAWANAEVLRALRSSPGSDPDALAQFAHVLAAEHLWLARLRGEPHHIAVWPTLTLHECEQLAAANRAGYAAILADATEASLAREVTYTTTTGATFANRVIDILLHVAMHGAYHRGITSLLTRRSGGTPAPTDYISYARSMPAATQLDAARALPQ